MTALEFSTLILGLVLIGLISFAYWLNHKNNDTHHDDK